MNLKITITTIITLILTSCYNQECRCDLVKTGHFKSEITVDDQLLSTDILRTEDYQFETFNNKTDTFSIRWINDCEFILKNANQSSKSYSKSYHYKILSTQSDSCYTYLFKEQIRHQKIQTFKAKAKRLNP